MYLIARNSFILCTGTLPNKLRSPVNLALHRPFPSPSSSMTIRGITKHTITTSGRHCEDRGIRETGTPFAAYLLAQSPLAVGA